jgi:hypothetical protein
MHTYALVIRMKLRQVLFLVLVIFALVANPASAKSDNAQGNGPDGNGPPGQMPKDDEQRPGNGYGDENHIHTGPPGQSEAA